MKKTKKIRLLFDANPMVNKHRSGIGYYLEHLVQALAHNYDEDIILVGQYYNFLNRHKNLDLPRAANIQYRPTYLIPGKLVNLLRRFRIEIPFELLAKSRGDFILFSSYTSYPSLFHTPCATAIHDLAFVDMPETVSVKNLRDMRRYVPVSVKRSRFIIALSEVMKRKIVSHFKIKEGSVVVTHIPPQASRATSSSHSTSLMKMGISKPFILFVGNLEPRKNIVGLIKAYCLLDENIRKKYSLVLAGVKGWNDEEIVSLLEAAQKDGMDIIVPGYVDDGQRNALYDSAEFLAFVTYYEGFGMPILEAMAHGLPVLASDISVLHEVAGDAALYCDPHNPMDISNKMTSLIESDTLKSRLTTKGKNQLKLYSWDAVAKTVYDAVQQNLNN